MPSIYDNICEVEQLLDTVFDIETGEIDEEKERELIQLREQIIISGLEKLCNLRANKEAYVKALKEEEDRINAKRKTVEKKLTSLDDYILLIHQKSGQQKSIAGSWTVSTRKSTQVILDDDFNNENFQVIKEVKTVDKAAIKEALKNGEDVDGAKLVTNYNLQIK
jgi:hypothetical protein